MKKRRKVGGVIFVLVMLVLIGAVGAGIWYVRRGDREETREAGSVTWRFTDSEEAEESGEDEKSAAADGWEAGRSDGASEEAVFGESGQTKGDSEAGNAPEECPEPGTEPLETTEAGGLTELFSGLLASAENASAQDTGYYGALQVIGTQLSDAAGNPVQLRGISTHGLAWFPDYVNAELFRQLHEEWKMNVVRLAMYTAEYGGYCAGGDRERLKELIRNGVQYATENDMYVIIDWHILSDSNPNTYKEDAQAFFAEMSAAYCAYDNVLYEICNEPNGGTGWDQIKAYAEEIIPVIRENDADAVILVGTPNWSQYVDQAAADPIGGYDNIMYTLHFYAATHTDGLRNTMSAAIEAGLPVFVSEYGICDASGSGAVNAEQADAWVELMNRYGVSYVAWNLSNKNETSAVFKSSCNKTGGFTMDDLSASGRWLYEMLTGSGGSTGGNASGAANGSSGGNAQGAANGSTGGNAQGAVNGSSGGNVSGAVNGSSNGGNATIHNGVTAGGLTAALELKNGWESQGEFYYQYGLTLTNPSQTATDGWTVTVSFDGDFRLSDSWCGSYTAEGKTLRITPADYNAKLDGGASTSDIGFIVSGGSGLNAWVE